MTNQEMLGASRDELAIVYMLSRLENSFVVLSVSENIKNAHVEIDEAGLTPTRSEMERAMKFIQDRIFPN